MLLCPRNQNCDSTFRGRVIPLWREAKASRYIPSFWFAILTLDLRISAGIRCLRFRIFSLS